jgi:hypothetical protein
MRFRQQVFFSLPCGLDQIKSYVERKRGCKGFRRKRKKILDIKYHNVVPNSANLNKKGGDVVEMDMQDSADMCSCATKLDKLLRKRRRKGRADLRRL